nr:hypothetical protein [Streptomyces graminilatus]
MNLCITADLTADVTPEKRERIVAIKAKMIDAERGQELAALPPTSPFRSSAATRARSERDLRCPLPSAPTCLAFG